MGKDGLMADFIDRALATSHPFANGRYDHENANEHFILGHESYREWLEGLPSADVRPVRRGQWKMDSDGIPHCTECGCVAPQRLFLQIQSLACTTKFIMSNYCPDCGSYNGADMRGGDANG